MKVSWLVAILILFGYLFPDNNSRNHLNVVYNLSCQLVIHEETAEIIGKNSVHISNSWDQPLGELYFRLTPNARETGLSLESVEATRDIRISGEKTPYLQLGLFPALKPGEHIIIDFQFSTRIAPSKDPMLSQIRQDSSSIQVLAQHFYPTLECFHNNGWMKDHHNVSIGYPQAKGDYNVDITVPEDMDVVSGSRENEVTSKPVRRKSYRFVETNVNEFAFIASTETEMIESEDSPFLLRAAVTGKNQQPVLKNALKMIDPVLHVYHGWLGDFPKNELTVVAFQDLPARVISWKNLIVFHPVLLDEPTISHELARQWFGFYVGATEPNEIWLNESLAEFYVWRYEQRMLDETKKEIQNQTNVFKQLRFRYRHMTRDEWMRVILEVMGDRVDYPKFEPGKHTRWETSSHLYSQYVVGSHALQILEHTVGSDVMDEIVDLYLSRYKYGYAATDDFIDIVKEICGKGTADNFRLALTTNIRPDFQIRSVEGEEKSPHQWETKVTTEYDGDWSIPVDALAITTTNDSLRIKQVNMAENKSLVFTSKDPIKLILIDPENKMYDANRFNNRWPRRLIFRPLLGRPSWDVYSISYRPRFYKDWLQHWRLGLRISGGLGLNLMPIMPALFQNRFNLDITFSTGMPENNWGGNFSYSTPLSSIHRIYWKTMIDYTWPRNRQILSLIDYIGEPSYYLTSGVSRYNRFVTEIQRVEYTDTLTYGWWDRGIQYRIIEEFKRFYYSGDRRYMIQVFGLLAHSLRDKEAFNSSRFTLAADGEQHLWDWIIARGHVEFGFTWDKSSEDILRYRLQYLPRIWKDRRDIVPLYRGFVKNPDLWWNTVAGSGFSFGYETDWFAWPMIYMDLAFVSEESGSVADRLQSLTTSINGFMAGGIGIESQSLFELGVYFPVWLSHPPEGESFWYPRMILQWGYYF